MKFSCQEVAKWELSAFAAKNALFLSLVRAVPFLIRSNAPISSWARH